MKSNQLQKNIPDGWKEVRLIDTVSFLDSKRIPIESDERSTRKGIYPYYGASGIIDYIDDYIFDGEFILLGEDGANILDRSSRLAFIVKGKIWVNNHAHIFQAKENIKLYFLSEYLESLSYEKFNTGSAQPKLNRSVCEKIPVLLPPLPEQNRIVSVLETWDKTIENLNKKIEIKKQIKKALMQDLLTGKKRLGGFKDKWEFVNLGETCKEIKTGKLDANAMVENGKYRFYTCAKDFYYIDDYAFDTEALLVSGNGANVGYIHYYKGKFNAYQRTYVLYGFTQNIIFIKYILDLFLKTRIKEEVREGNTPYITMDTLTDMSIKIPSVKEQAVIAEILTTADEEIVGLEKKLKIIKEQKKYLLNNLITGVIRTPENLSINIK